MRYIAGGFWLTSTHVKFVLEGDKECGWLREGTTTKEDNIVFRVTASVQADLSDV